MVIISWRRAAALGVTVAGATAAGVVAQVVTDRGRSRRRAQQGDDAVFGGLHSAAQQIEASDGVLLNVEVDEPDGDVAAGTPTVVFVHGWVLDLNCWHYQRAALRGRARLVFYDQRSHGRSGRSPAASSTHEQLGRDLRTVLESVAPDGPVVLVGHSMGGRTSCAVADEAAVVGVVTLAPWLPPGEPIDHIGEHTPLLVTHGTGDRWTSAEASRQFVERVRASGGAAAWFAVQGAGHFMFSRVATWNGYVRGAALGLLGVEDLPPDLAGGLGQTSSR